MSIFHVGDYTDDECKRIPCISVENNDVLESITKGSVVGRWGYQMQWDDDCVVPSLLERRRWLGDPLCDNAVKFLNPELKAGQDIFGKLIAYVDSTPKEEWDESVKTFWDHIAREPPEGISAFPPAIAEVKGNAQAGDIQEVLTSCERRPKPTVAEGQAVFWRYSAQLFSALFHFSLAGFSVARITSVLDETGYLTHSSREATFLRLLETTQFDLDVATDLKPLTSVGWKSCIRVRMLHSQVRQRILAGRGIFKKYSVEREGIPVNQQDLVSTLGGFSVAPIWCLRRLGLGLTKEEEEAYLALWRHIGYYMGVDLEGLSHFSRGISAAEKYFACNIFHLYPKEPATTDPKLTPTYKMLSSIAGRPPQHTSMEWHIEVARIFMGDGLADHLLLPRNTSLIQRGRVSLELLAGKFMVLFGRYYPRSEWEIERKRHFRTAIGMLVTWNLGMKRTKFSLKEREDQGKQPHEVGAGPGGEGKYGNEGGDAEETAVKVSKEEGKKLRRGLRENVAEMVLVVASIALVLASGISLPLWKASNYDRFGIGGRIAGLLFVTRSDSS